MSFVNFIFFLCFFLVLVIALIISLMLLVALGKSLWAVFFSTLLIVCCCTLPVRGAVCFPPNCSTRTPTDTLMTTALCASPAARMRRGRDERRAEGAVTCGRATRACGAEHTFLSLLFCFYAVRAGRHPQRHTHTATPCRRVFLFIFLLLCEFLAPCVVVDVGPYRIYRCHPPVPLAVLMCLPVLLLFPDPPAHTQVLAQFYAGMLLATRLVGCSDFHQACSGRAGGVVFLVRHTLLCECLFLAAHTAWRPPPSACAHLPAPACSR
ncbi:hypothetical protein TCDM_12484 [Trypanosoma cruzi Dm28c]|uniref:Uncharacterized protein n=1 Tax=Trypanosoma cruzi Dm28c TaxID=1416333 RepID=V5A689_TRYCR|nr:hypothetical protein TCDM_12484 [Trypanosoma cruzi Dm28c]